MATLPGGDPRLGTDPENGSAMQLDNWLAGPATRWRQLTPSELIVRPE